jgi:archaellum component FlaG (FlaF/FlaG flagellin family)
MLSAIMIFMIVFSTLIVYRMRSVKAPSYPDLIVADISWIPSSSKAGDSMTFTAYIKNQGQVAADPWAPFDVQYYVDGSNLGEWIIYSLNVGETISRQFTWTATSGTHTVKAYADYSGFIPEGNEGNNERQESFTVTPAGNPDLVISDISWTPGSSKVGDSMTFTVYIENQGTADTSPWGPFDVQYYIDSPNLGEWTIDNVSPGSTISRQFQWSAETGDHTVKACADHGGFIPEGNEGNNERTETFHVSSVDLTISDISWSPDSPKVGDDVTFTVYIKNQGDIETSPWGSFDVQYYVDGSNLGGWIIDNVPAGDTTSRQFHWVAASESSHTVSAYADHGDFIPENNEGNNQRTETLPVGPATQILQIISLECPSEVIINQDLSLNVNIEYSLSTTTTIRIQVYEHAGPLLGWTQDTLSGSGSKTYPFALTAPSTPSPDWQLNIHLFYWDMEWIQSDIESVHIIVNDEPHQNPIAVLSASPTDVEVDETVTFDGSRSYDPDGTVEYYWFDFGDGFDSGWVRSSTYLWSYTDYGEYYAKVRVKDNGELISDWSDPIKINVAHLQLVQLYFPYLIFDENETYFPTDFYYDDEDIHNNTSHYATSWPNKTFVHMVQGNWQEKEYLVIEYWFYYVRDDKLWGWVGAHDHDWESIYVFLEKENGDYVPSYISYFKHVKYLNDLSTEDFFNTYSWESIDLIPPFEKKDGTHPIVHVAVDSHGSYETTILGYGQPFYYFPFGDPPGAPYPEPVDGGEEIDYGDFEIIFVSTPDPSWPSEKFGDIDAPWNRSRWNNPWFLLIPRLVKNGLSLVVGSPVNILVVDPEGRRVGYDPETHTVVNEIPNATYSGPGSEPQIISIPDPLTGNYTIGAFGTGTGEYTITIQSTASNRSIVDSETWQGTAIPDEQYSETMRLDSEGRLIWPHDIEIISLLLSKTVVGQGYCTNITVTITNWGDFTESFNVTVFRNDTAIILPDGKNYTNITLTNGISTTVTFTWNTSGFAKGNYTIKACITQVSGETDTTDNNLTDGWILVTIPGDVDGDFENGHYDVDLYDAVRLLACYGLKQNESGFDINCDIDNDGRVFLFDAVILLSHYGQKYP